MTDERARIAYAHRKAFDAWFGEYVKSPALNANDCDDLRQRTWTAWQAAIIAHAQPGGRYAEGIEDAIKAAERVGNFGDYKRDELTEDYGKPRFDMMHNIIDAIRALGAQP